MEETINIMINVLETKISILKDNIERIELDKDSSIKQIRYIHKDDKERITECLRYLRNNAQHYINYINSDI